MVGSLLEFFAEPSEAATPLVVATSDEGISDVAELGDVGRQWLESTGFATADGSTTIVPAADGTIAAAVAIIDTPEDPYAWAALPGKFPKATYRLSRSPINPTVAALGWGLGCYRFTRYHSSPKLSSSHLVWPDDADRSAIAASLDAIKLTRDLINTPAEDMGPADLEAVVRATADRFGAHLRVVRGDALLAQNYPTIHAVGRAAAPGRAPRLLDLTWGDDTHPKVTVIGKGVCFDTGGLDLKSAQGMLMMKKDMGGAAHALGLAHLIMETGLPIRLRLLIPAVENAVSDRSFRPGDIITTRKKLTVEIGNTDAEGRLVLCDALADADDDDPDLIVDFATLTGAARVALGTDLPAAYISDDAIAGSLITASDVTFDPLWRMPLWQGYNRLLDSRIADINNISSGPYAGSITAALFLQRFLSPNRRWIHFDVFAWTPSARPGRSEGAIDQGLRAAFSMIASRYD